MSSGVSPYMSNFPDTASQPAHPANITSCFISKFKDGTEIALLSALTASAPQRIIAASATQVSNNYNKKELQHVHQATAFPPDPGGTDWEEPCWGAKRHVRERIRLPNVLFDWLCVADV